MELLIPNHFYHIYNRAISSEKMFVEPNNYVFFLKKVKHHLLPILDIYAYCLIPNHFHLLIKLKDEKDISKTMSYRMTRRYQDCDSFIEKDRIVGLHISKQFSNLFSSYAQSINRMYNRRGSLFTKNFKRRIVTDDRYLQELIIYIHNNPVKHGLVKSPENWFNSSYNAVLNNNSLFISRTKVIDLFDDLDNFRFCHK